MSIAGVQYDENQIEPATLEIIKPKNNERTLNL